MNIGKLSLALAWVLLPGCMAAPVTGEAPHTLTVTGQVRARTGSPAAYALQATRVPYELKRLSKIECFIKDTTNNAAEVDMGEVTHTGSGDADHVFAGVKIKSLAPNRAYTVRLEAYQIDPAVSATAAVRVDLNDNHQSETSFSTNLTGPGIVVGSSEDTLDIDVERNVLTVKAERVARNGDWEMLASERPRGLFSRQLVLGDNLDLERIEASYADGVLRLRIPVAEKARPRKIEVNYSEQGTPALSA